MKTEDFVLLLATAVGGLALYRWFQTRQQSGRLIRVNSPASPVPRANPASPFAAPGVPLFPWFAPTVQNNLPSLNYLALPPGSVWNEETDGYMTYYPDGSLGNVYL